MIDWPATHREALEIFVRYLQIDTSNPPGNEKPAARYLGGLLEAEGIECEYIETAPDREVLVARLRGDGSKRPLML
ncbi:MAG: peptidase M20, partial [Tepidiformaceae bacterium]